VKAGRLADSLWQPLGRSAVWLVHQLFVLAGWETVYDPEQLRVGTSSFAVTIASECSGYEGIGLIWVFLGVYLWLFRHSFRFPRVLLLFPLGTVVVWLANVLRLVLLVVLGTRVSPEMALGGFHSQAGWLAFLAVSLGLAALAQHTRFFSTTVAPAAPAPGPNATVAYLAPLLALVATTMLTAAFTANFDQWYPLRVLAVAAALWVCRRGYEDLQWSRSWAAVALGAGAFVLWIALEPAGSASAEETFADQLAGLPTAWATVWLSFRVVGSIVTVPLAEELAFRGYLTRQLIAADFQEVPLGRFTWFSFLVSSALFGVLHGRWLAGTLAGLLYALALYRRGELADAVVAHATTNALLAAYVLMTGTWTLWL
jgi:exosortase E/protease (VPEID-CTERM system)